MKKVYVCAPLGGNIEQNLKKVKTYTEYALRCGTAPVVPHFYAECLDDNNPKDREVRLSPCNNAFHRINCITSP